MTSRARLLVALLGLAAVVSSGACAGPSRIRPPMAAASRDQPPFLYVAVGGSDSVGAGADEPLRQAWTQLFYRKALPRSAAFVNLGVPGLSLEEALLREGQEAVALGPQLVTVWLNVKEVLLQRPPEEYASDLAGLLRLLRRTGDTEVLVANVPPLDRLPAYQACLSSPSSAACPIHEEVPPSDVIQSHVAGFNAAIAQVVGREGAILVDLHAAGLVAREAGREELLVAEDGFHLSVQGHEAVADAFAEAWRRNHKGAFAPLAGQPPASAPVGRVALGRRPGVTTARPS